jgi:hypothetical protein
MRAKPRKFILAALSVHAAACADTTGPVLSVDLCPNASWAGMQREGAPWVTIPTAPGPVAAGSKERLGLARIRGNSLEIYYVTTEQAQAAFSCEATTKELHGTVRGIGTAFTSQATISMGTSRAFAAAQGSEDFTLRLAPSGPADLVATATDVGPMTIMRRGVDYPNGSAIPVLDFGAAEAFALQANIATVDGTDNFEFAATSEVITQRGTQGMLRYTFRPGGSTTVLMYSVPESKLLAGELNSLTVDGPFGRVVTVYYRSPSDRSVALGPTASVPVVTRSGSAPNRGMRIDVASQAEYGSQITLMLCASQPALVPTIVATKEYFGDTPTTWSFTVPDFLAVDGFPSSWPDPRLSGLCGIRVSDRPYDFSPQSANDGDTYRSALGSGVVYTP